MAKLTLFYHDTCPYCLKVLEFMKENNMSLPLKNVHETAENRQELMTKGGKGQVPALEIDDRVMYESDDIIAWLQENYK